MGDERRTGRAGEPGELDPGLAVDAAQQGDTDAFRVLYRDIQPRLLRYLRALVGEDAEDVASEAWLQVARDLGGFRGSYDGFRGWVVTVGRHRALDHLRREGRRPPAVLVPTEDLASLAAADDTAADALEAVATDAAIRLIATLPRDQAEAVLLRAVVGLDAASAGSASPGATVGRTTGGSTATLCRDLASRAGVTSTARPAALTQALASPAFSRLTGATGKVATVPDYCALVLALPRLPQPALVGELPPAVLARALTSLAPPSLATVLTSLPPAPLAQTLTSLPGPALTSVLTTLPAPALGTVLITLPPRSLARVLTGVKPTVQSRILGELPASVLLQLASSALAKLPASVLATLPASVLAPLPVG